MSALIFAAITLAYLGACAKDRYNALIGAAVLLPYNQYLPASGITLVNIHSVIVFALLWSLLRGGPDDGRQRPTAPWSLAIFGVFLIISYFNARVVDIPDEFIDLYRTTRLLPMLKEKLSVLFIGYAAFKLADSVDVIKRVFWGATFGFGLEQMFCFAEFLFKDNKVTGHLQVKNATGAFLATYAAVALGMFVVSKGVKWRWIWAGIAFCGAVASVGTRSRGGVLALGATMMVLALWKNRTLFVVLMVLVLSYQLWMPAYLVVKFDRAIDFSEEGGIELQETAGDRIELWKAGIRTIPDYPFGIGLEMFKIIVPQTKYLPLEAMMFWRNKVAHNEFMTVLVEQGTLALIVFVVLLATLAFGALRVMRQDENPFMRGVAFGTLCGLMGGVTASMALSLVLRSDISGILWILLGMCARRGRDLQEAARVAREKARRTLKNNVRNRPAAREPVRETP